MEERDWGETLVLGTFQRGYVKVARFDFGLPVAEETNLAERMRALEFEKFGWTAGFETNQTNLFEGR